MNHHTCVFSQLHQSKLVKILSVIIVFCMIGLSVEPAMATLTEEPPPYDLQARLQEIRAEVDAEYERNQHNESFRDLLQNLHKKGRNGTPASQRNPFDQLNRGQRPDPYFGRSAPVAPLKQHSTVNASQTGTLPKALTPNPLRQLPPYVRKNLSENVTVPAQSLPAETSQTQDAQPAEQTTTPASKPSENATQSSESEENAPTSPEEYSEILKQAYQQVAFQRTQNSSQEQYILLAQAGGTIPLGSHTRQTITVVSDPGTYIEETGSGAVTAWQPGGWDKSLIDPSKGTTWLWSSYQVTWSEARNGATRTFVESFNVPSGATNITGTLFVAADNWLKAYLNGNVFVNKEPGFAWVSQFSFTPQIGNNTLKLAVTNFADSNSSPTNNPAGVIYRADISYDLYQTLQVNTSGTGSGTIKGTGINCGSGGTDCTETYNRGANVTLTVIPDAGSTFAGWEGACSGTGNCVVTMNTDKVATARFAQNGLLAHWKFDQNTLDFVGNYHGTQSGGIAYVEGEIDEGVLLDGKDDYITVNNSANGLSFGGTAPFTIDGWINPRKGGSGGYIISKFNENVRGEYYFKINSNGTFHFHREVNPWNVTAAQTIPFGEFTHVAMTYDGATIRLYLNGKPTMEQAMGAQATDTITPVLIGAQYTNNMPSGFFDGIIDDLRFYNRALTREEILYYATETKPGPLSDKDRERFRKLGVKPCMPGTGDPVNSATGNHLQQFSDLSVPGLGGLDFAIERTYNGLDDRDGLFGRGWSSFLDVNLRIANDGNIDLRYPDGSSVYFVKSGDAYVPGQEGIFDTLTKMDVGINVLGVEESAAIFAFTGFKVSRPDQSAYLFDFKGRLTAIVDRHGHALTLHWNADHHLTRITDTVGREFSIVFDGVHITSITDPLGRIISYAYDANGNLVKVTDANGGIRLFEYADQRIVRVTDPSGIVYLHNVYDTEGRVIEQSDANGKDSYFDYNTPNQTVFTDNLGNKTTYLSDNRSRVTEIRDALGFSEHNVYDADDNLIAYTDKRSNTWTYNYDDRGNLLTETDPTGATTTMTYNATNDLASLTNANGGVTTYTWQDGKLVKITQPDGSTLQSTYNVYGQILTQTYALGQTTTYTYDTHGNLATVQDPLGSTTAYAYDAVGRQIRMTDANGHTVQFAYDGKDNATQVTYPDGSTVAFAYSLNDDVIRMTDRRGGTTAYQYDANLKLAAETDPEGATTRYEYDAVGRMVKETDPRGNATVYRYDAIGRLVEVENALGKITQFTPDANGNVTLSTDPLGQQTRFEYDALNRLVKETNALNGVTTFSYNALGQTATIRQANGATTQYTYDQMGRLTAVRDALGNSSQMTYDAVGNLTGVTDANGHNATLRYDAAGNVSEQINSLSKRRTFTYDAVGNQLTATDELGRTTTSGYDRNDNLIAITDPLGYVTKLTYDAADNLVTITDANGNPTTFGYDRNGVLTQVTDTKGHTTQYVYDAAQNLVKQTDAKGGVWTFIYDALNRRVTTTDPLNRTTRQSYDDLDRLVALTDAAGNIAKYDYDALDRVVKITDPLGGVRQLAYDAADNLIAETDPRGATTRYAYDALDQLVEIQDALGGAQKISYDAVGNITALSDANGHTVMLQYDAEDNLLEEVDALGQRTQYTYDAVGNLAALTDALNRVTRYAYDAGDNLTEIADALGNKTNLAYDPAGNLLTLTDANGHATRFTYDAAGLLIAETLPGGQTTQYEYDALANLIKYSNAKSNAWTYTYDALDRLISERDPLGNATTYEYDALDNLIALTDANGHKTQYAYDALARLTEVRQPTDAITRYGYDAADNLTALTNAIGKTTQFKYDLLNRLIAETDPLGKIWQYEYDAAGNLRRSNANGLVTQYAYDANDQLTNLTHPDGASVGFAYDAAGNELTMTDRLGATHNEYDALDRLIATTNHAGLKVGYSYDAVGNLRKLTYPDQRAVAYDYDANDAVQRIIDPDSKVFDVTRDAAQNVLKIANPNSTAVEYTYDAADRLTGVRNVQGSAIISAFDYTLDAVGNRIAAAEEYRWRTPRQLTHAYTYDALDRLVKSADSEGNFTEYAFDAAGNRLSHATNIAETRERLKTEYSYGAENRLTGVKNFIADANGNWKLRDKTEVQYDGHDRAARRIHTQDGKQTQIDYSYDGLDPLAEYLDGGAQHVNYYRGVEQLLSLAEVDAQGQVQPSYFHPDGLNSITALTDAQGQLAHSYRYRDYGDLLNGNDDPAALSDLTAPQNRYTYTGQEADPSNRLYHFFARDYDPEVGVWLQQDAYRGQPNDPASLHRYAYVKGNPTSDVDQYGFYSLKDLKKGAKNIGKKIKNEVKKTTQQVVKTANQIKTATVSTVKTVKKQTAKIVKQAQKIVQKATKTVQKKVAKVVKKAQKTLKKAVKQVVKTVKNTAKNVKKAAVTAVKKTAKKLADTAIAAKKATVKLAKEELLPRCKLLKNNLPALVRNQLNIPLAALDFVSSIQNFVIGGAFSVAAYVTRDPYALAFAASYNAAAIWDFNKASQRVGAWGSNEGGMLLRPIVFKSSSSEKSWKNDEGIIGEMSITFFNHHISDDEKKVLDANSDAVGMTGLFVGLPSVPIKAVETLGDIGDIKTAIDFGWENGKDIGNKVYDILHK